MTRASSDLMRTKSWWDLKPNIINVMPNKCADGSIWFGLFFQPTGQKGAERKRYDEKGENISLLLSWIKFVNLQKTFQRKVN